MELDAWQKEVIDCGINDTVNIAIRSSRQAGKSTAISVLASEFAIKYPKSCIMVCSSTERQAFLLFQKILDWLLTHHIKKIKTGVDRPTKHRALLTNGSEIRCEPTGLSGIGLRGFTIDLLIADEAHYIDDAVFNSLTPALATRRKIDKRFGRIVLLSTPRGKEGFFYDCFSDPTFRTWHVRWTDCDRLDTEFIEQERRRKTKTEFTQEYDAEFIDKLMQFFPTQLIRECMVLHRGKEAPSLVSRPSMYDAFMGVDVARLGNDESTFASMYRIDKEKLEMFDMEITEKTLLTDTVRRILVADRRNDYRKIYIDTTGVGAGVFDPLLEHDQTKRKVVSIENAFRPLDRNESHKKKILKEDLYSNLLRLMEAYQVKFFDEPEILLSLQSVQYEYSDTGGLKIFGRYTHIAEALVRAAWCMKDKSLNLWCR